MGFLNIQNNSIVVFFSIIIGSTLFITNSFSFPVEFIFISWLSLFFILGYFSEPLIYTSNGIDINCGWIWIGWIGYGILFKNIVVSKEISQYISVFIFLFVILTYTRYVQESVFLMDVSLLLNLVFLFTPNNDNIYFSMTQQLFIIKVTLFIFLYIFSDADIWISKKIQSPAPSSCHCRYIKIIRSTWILYITKDLLVIIIIQLVSIVISMNYKLKTNETPILPVVSTTPVPNMGIKLTKETKEKRKKNSNNNSQKTLNINITSIQNQPQLKPSKKETITPENFVYNKWKAHIVK